MPNSIRLCFWTLLGAALRLRNTQPGVLLLFGVTIRLLILPRSLSSRKLTVMLTRTFTLKTRIVKTTLSLVPTPKLFPHHHIRAHGCSCDEKKQKSS